MTTRITEFCFPKKTGVIEAPNRSLPSNNWIQRWFVSPIRNISLTIRDACNPVSVISTLSLVASVAIKKISRTPVNNAIGSVITGISIPPIIYSLCKKLNPNRVDRLMLIGSTGLALIFTSLQLCARNSRIMSSCSNIILATLGVNFSVLAKHIYIRGIFRSDLKQQKIFLIIFGPPAAGKMTIGQELAKRTNLILFHNHVLIEPLLTIFDFKDPHFRKLIHSFRNQIFEEVSQSSLKGIIFTFVWNFNNKQSKESIDNWSAFFKSTGGKVYAVELSCDLKERLERNRTENRLINKASKRDINKSETILMENERDWKMQSDDNFYYGDKFIRINNSNMTASQVAELIIKQFNLQ